MIKVDMDGLGPITRKLRNMSPEITKEVKAAIIRSAFLVENEAKKAIAQGEKSGKIYKRRGISHQASAPGQAPATDRGRLIASISHQEFAEGLGVLVGTGMKYGKFLELGTRHIRPRPWLFPSFRKHVKNITLDIAKSVKLALGRA